MRYTHPARPPRGAGRRARKRQRTMDLVLMLVMIPLSLLAVFAGARAFAAWSAQEPPAPAETAAVPAAGAGEDHLLSAAAGDAPAPPHDHGEAAPRGDYDFSRPVPPSDPVGSSYFDDAVFIGDSRTQGLFLNTSLSNATSFAHMGLMVDTVFTRPLVNVNGEKVPVIDAMKKAEFSKVYIMLGINETGWAYSSIFIQKYGEIIDAIREINPDALIYVQAILPVSQKVSSTHSYVKNPKITEYNQLLLQLAEEKQVYYIDTASAVAGEDGSLPDDAAPDGIHLVRAYCQRWLDYLMTHTVVQ